MGRQIWGNCATLCRHRALLFHVLATEAELKSTLKGGSMKKHKEPISENDHQWCIIQVDGRSQKFDLMDETLIKQF